MEYYENVSLSIDNDDYFEMLINNTWGFNNENDNNYINSNKKGWSNLNENNDNNLQNNYKRRFGDNNRNNNNFNKINEKEQIQNEFYTNENNILDIFRGGKGIIGLAKQFKLFDENKNKTLDYQEFSKAIKNLKIDFNENEIQKLFYLFDNNKSNSIDYEEFLKKLIGEMNEKRKEIVLKAFDKLDLDKSGKIELSEIKSLYNVKNHKDVLSGKKTEEDLYNEFIETFEMHHNLKKGFKEKRVSKEEFLEYYNNISMSIDDDDLFINLISNAWKLNNQFKYLKKKPWSNIQDNNNSINNEQNYNYYNRNNDNINNNNINQENDENRKKGKNLSEKNSQLRNYQNAPFGTYNEPINYSTWNNPNNMKMRIYENLTPKNIDTFTKLKDEINGRGIRGIMSMRRNFMISDEDNSKNINLNDFKKYCNDYRIELNDEEINNIFNKFDTNENGIINYENLINELIGEMNNFRKEIVRRVFYKFNKNNLVYLEDLRKNYNAKEHPDVLNGKKNYYECLAEFLDCFEYHFTLLNNENKYKNKMININDLIDFYNYISSTIDNDQYFENMMINVWGLKNW